MLVVNAICASLMGLALPNAEQACAQLPTILEMSEKYDIRPAVMVALIHEESRYKANAVSRAGACGLTQVLPKYTQNPKLSCRQLKNPRVAIETGSKTLSKFYYSSYAKQNYKTALCTYNAGYRCKKSSASYSENGHRYAKRILRRAARIARAANSHLSIANRLDPYIDNCAATIK